ncbi:MAG: DUF1269 domain-containing protein [Candidatus Promineifilaceae bacterium]|nr:DUF1269 domain-containing protein [Candidatus Promineifilaceae bacterium]
MSELIVLAFDDKKGAQAARDELKQLSKEELIDLRDAAVVVRNEDESLDIDQAVSLVGAGALGGAFWGMLIGLLFFMPWLGLAVGGITGAIAGKLTDYGVDDDFIRSVGETIEPGNSALFMLIRRWTEDRVMARLSDFDPTVIRTSLSREDEARLRSAFGAASKQMEPEQAA